MNNRKKVVFVTQSLNRGGVEKALETLSKLLVDCGMSVTIMCMNAEGSMKSIFDEYCNVVQMPGLKTPMDNIFSEVRKGHFISALKKIVWSLRFKIEHNQYKKQMLLTRLLPSYNQEEFDYAIAYHSPFDLPVTYTINNIKAKEYIYYLHLEMPQTDQGQYDGFERIFEKYNKIICVAKDTAKSFLNRYSHLEKKVSVIYNLIDVERILQMADEPISIQKVPNVWTICTVGRLSKQKGYDIAIEACRILLNEGYSVKWYAVGGGEEYNNLETLAKTLDGAFEFLGDQPNPYPFIKMADIYVQPSRFEGYCITLAEACILKKCIVTTGFAGAFEQIISEENGLIVETNARSIAMGIKRVIDSKELRDMFEKNVAFAGNNVDIEKLKAVFMLE